MRLMITMKGWSILMISFTNQNFGSRIWIFLPIILKWRISSLIFNNKIKLKLWKKQKQINFQNSHNLKPPKTAFGTLTKKTTISWKIQICTFLTTPSPNIICWHSHACTLSKVLGLPTSLRPQIWYPLKFKEIFGKMESTNEKLSDKTQVLF